MRKSCIKLIAFCLAFVMTAGLSVGCIVINTPPASPTEAPASPEAEATEKPTELTPAPVPVTPEPTQAPTEIPSGPVNTLYLKPPYVHGMDMMSVETDELGKYTVYYVFSPSGEYDVYLTCACIESEMSPENMPSDDEVQSYILNTLGAEDNAQVIYCYDHSPVWNYPDYPCYWFSYLCDAEEGAYNVDGLVIFSDDFTYFGIFEIEAEYYSWEADGMTWAKEGFTFGSIPEDVVVYPRNTEFLMLPDIRGLELDDYCDPEMPTDGIYHFTYNVSNLSLISFCHPAAAADVPQDITDPENEFPAIIAALYQDFTPDRIQDLYVEEMDGIYTSQGESCRRFRLSYDVDAYGSMEHYESVMVISSEFVYVIYSFHYDNRLDGWFSQVHFAEPVG